MRCFEPLPEQIVFFRNDTNTLANERCCLARTGESARDERFHVKPLDALRHPACLCLSRLGEPRLLAPEDPVDVALALSVTDEVDVLFHYGNTISIAYGDKNIESGRRAAAESARRAHRRGGRADQAVSRDAGPLPHAG